MLQLVVTSIFLALTKGWLAQPLMRLGHIVSNKKLYHSKLILCCCGMILID